MTLSSCTEKPHQKEKNIQWILSVVSAKYLCKLAIELLQYNKFTTKPDQLKTGQTKSLTTET